MFKRILKIAGLLGIFVLLAVVSFLVWNWEKITIFTQNAELDGALASAPAAPVKQSPPLSRGEADWPCWRGPELNGRSSQKTIRTNWSGGLRKLWEIHYLCRGKASTSWSAPVVQGNRLVVMGRNENEDVVFCLDPADGGLIWRQSYAAPAGRGSGMGARATPFIDGDRVYTFGRAGDLVCWRLLDGAILWRQSVNDADGAPPKWGHSSSPLVTDTLVIVAGGGNARTVAYDKFRGELQWKAGTGEAGYAAITRMPIDGRATILAFHGKGLAAIDPGDGRVLWDTPWITSYDVNATTPVYAGNIVFITSGYGTGGRALKVSRSGAEPLWTTRAFASHHSDPSVIDGYIYGYSGDSVQNKGAFKCIALQTGEERWSTNAIGWGTCLYVAGHLLCMDIKGNLFLVRPSPERFEMVTKMPRALGRIRHAAWTIPVVANGRLFLRYKQQLVCYELTAHPAGQAKETED